LVKHPPSDDGERLVNIRLAARARDDRTAPNLLPKRFDVFDIGCEVREEAEMLWV
jgi:hypothetical protein